jgi:diguanylate cyclase (GGDEF)-like protein
MRRVLGEVGSWLDRSVNKQVRRDLLALTGFLAAGYILSINLNVVASLDEAMQQYGHLPLDRVFGTVIVAAVGLTLYGFSRSYTTMKALSQQVKADERARRIAMHDQLTGLPNRRHLKGLVNFLLSENDGSKRMAVMLLNLDRFKEFNDHYGRTVGDELLIAVGRLLNYRAGVDGFVARLGADDFAVVLQEKTEDQVIDWVSSLLSAIETPFALTNHQVNVAATVGVSMAIADGRDAETLLNRAELALRRAKESSRGWFAFFKNGMDERVRDRASFEHDLFQAVRDDEIEPWLQPIVSLADGKVCGYEILARWEHTERGIIAPDKFIPVAEATGAIGDMTLNLLRTACKASVDWEGAPRLSLNISPSQLQDELLAQRILKILAETGFPAKRLEVELTESAVVSDFEAARAVLDSLKNQGVRIAIDNFGTGHSSLHQLRSLTFDQLKIDRSFVQGIEDKSESALLLRTVVALARNLNLSVVAEGVETEVQAQALAALGCEQGQGHYFGKAATAGEICPPKKPDKARDPAPADETPAAEISGALAQTG